MLTISMPLSVQDIDGGDLTIASDDVFDFLRSASGTLSGNLNVRFGGAKISLICSLMWELTARGVGFGPPSSY